jgi:hypothetical protein
MTFASNFMIPKLEFCGSLLSWSCLAESVVAISRPLNASHVTYRNLHLFWNGSCDLGTGAYVVK